MRQFFSEADWNRAVELMRKGMTPAAAVAALGYSLSGMASEREAPAGPLLLLDDLDDAPLGEAW